MNLNFKLKIRIMDTTKNSSRSLIGFILILFGIIFAVEALDLFPRRIMRYIFKWEMILIVLGLIFLFSKQNKTTGLILFFIGLIFWLPDFYFFPYPLHRFVWPGILIILGIVIIFRSTSSNQVEMDTNTSEYIDNTAIFGNDEKIINTRNFKGGKITTIFGNSKIDLRSAQLSPGQNVIDVFCVFGKTSIILPENWNVRQDVVSIFGSFSQKNQFQPSSITMDVGKELIIKGFTLFGSGEIHK